MMERILTQTFTLPAFEPLTPEQIQSILPLEPLVINVNYFSR
jgi:hypothetical protein